MSLVRIHKNRQNATVAATRSSILCLEKCVFTHPVVALVVVELLAVHRAPREFVELLRSQCEVIRPSCWRVVHIFCMDYDEHAALLAAAEPR